MMNKLRRHPPAICLAIKKAMLRSTDLADDKDVVLLIRQQTGHASDATMSRHIREGSLFRGNAAGQLL